MSAAILTERQRRRLRDELRRFMDVRVYRRIVAVPVVDAVTAVADTAKRQPSKLPSMALRLP